MSLKSSPIAPVTAGAFVGPATVPTDGYYPSTDATFAAAFSDNSGETSRALGKCLPLGSSAGVRERGAELEFWGADAEDTSTVVHLFAIELVGAKVSDAAGFGTYRVRNLGTITLTQGTRALPDGAIPGVEDGSKFWMDTVASWTPTDYGVLVLNANDFAAPKLHSPGGDGIASVILPDLAGTFALGFVPVDNAVGIAAKRLT